MTSRAFRFGVVATPQAGVDYWLNLARRVESLGFSSLLMPDGIHLLAPWPSLTAAATVTSALHVGTFVVASPLRHPRICAWDAHSTSVITKGRFELGIGTGREDLVHEVERTMGIPYAPPAQRLAQVEDTIDQLRQLDGEQLRTPVMIAASGRRARKLAAEKADIIAAAASPLASREQVDALFAEIRELAGARFDQIELSMNLFVVGDQATPWMERFMGTDSATLREVDSLTMLRGDSPQAMADELNRRRDRYGASYMTVNAAFYEAMAPVVALLDGK
jgi:probable F420-dependent oxidoreductase